MQELRKRRPNLCLNLAAVRSADTTRCQNAEDDFHLAFELGETIGIGAFTVIKRARKRQDGELLAVKCVRSEDSEQIRITNREYEILRSMNNSCIVRATALYAFSRSMYMCLELCEDGTVHSYVRKNGAFSEKAAHPLVEQLLYAVRYLHHRRIVHCDIKTENLLLRSTNVDMCLKLADFNSAKRLGEVACPSVLTCRGTKYFKAPELVLDCDWNERVDIWAAGLCAFYLLRARLPFKLDSKRVAAIVRATELPAVKWDDMTASCQHLLKQCFIVSPFDRPPAAELLQHPVFDTDSSSGSCSDGATASPFDLTPTGELSCSVAYFTLSQNGHGGQTSKTASYCSQRRRVSGCSSTSGLRLNKRKPSKTCHLDASCRYNVDEIYQQLAHVKWERDARDRKRCCIPRRRWTLD
eukprot:TRINITY_DN73371_c0_g1_i1.p1 TRINITY_DN73371_c0_g1~~TRINITY_DN73371_c0_g1_i1.p1  ORF type:complete len:420 (+),score=32.02 TRINITY_DN73371_c0_g1_i1:29-1261(+)